MRTVSTTLHDLLATCSSLSTTNQSSQNAKPELTYKFTVQAALTATAYNKLLTDDEDAPVGDEEFNWYPNCITDEVWIKFLQNPIDKDNLTAFTKQTFNCKVKGNEELTITPPF